MLFRWKEVNDCRIKLPALYIEFIFFEEDNEIISNKTHPLDPITFMIRMNINSCMVYHSVIVPKQKEVYTRI